MERVLVLAVAVGLLMITGCQSATGQKETVGMTNEQIDSDVTAQPKVKRPITEEERRRARDNFCEILKENHPDKVAYQLLQNAAEILRQESEIIEELREKRGAYGKIEEFKENLSNMTRWYAELAAAYNEKMTAINFKFSGAEGLPEGETEILPRVFAIK